MNFSEPLNEKQIERHLWYIKNKALFKKIIIILLCIVILFFYSFSILKFLTIKIQDNYEKNNYQETFINFQEWQEKNKPENLLIVEKNIISLKNNKYDIVIAVKNPNEKIAISKLRYQFVYNNKQESEEKETFILPQDTKKLINLNVESNQRIRSVELKIIDIAWQRLKSSEIENLPSSIFLIKDKIINVNNKDTRNWIKFTAINQTPYSWLESEFYISLRLGTKVVAINKVTIDEFYSLEEKSVETSWFYQIPSYVSLEIDADVNFLDPENYIIQN